MHHSDFIKMLAEIYTPEVYLELGLYEGETFNKVKPYTKRAIGVDLRIPANLIGELYQESTQQFFSHFTDKVDMIFIDADHSFLSVVNDFESSSQLLKPRGIILLHDTNPINKDLVDPGYCGDCYKIITELEMDPNINAVTLPLAEAGLTLITWKNQLRINE